VRHRSPPTPQGGCEHIALHEYVNALQPLIGLVAGESTPGDRTAAWRR
jgi:hypothetical protein